MSSQDFHNWCKLEFLTTAASEFLRNHFKQLWKARFNKAWDNTSGQDLIKIIKQKSFNSYFKPQKNDLQKGDIDHWDFTLLRNVFIDSDICGAGQKGVDLRKNIEKLAEVRNKIAHNASNNVSDAEFEVKWERMSSILIEMGESKDKLDELKVSLRSNKMMVLRSQNITKANEMKLKGNDYFQEKKYTEAISSYTGAIDMKDIPDHDLAILYSNRSMSYLKRKKDNNIENALKDAKECKKLRPEWSKACFRLGKAYFELNKLDKAVKEFDEGLILEPNNEELKNALADAKKVRGAQNRYDHVDPTIYGVTQEQLFEYVHARTGKHLKQEDVEKTIQFILEKNPILKDVAKAHEYRDAANYVKATEFYRKAADQDNAEAMYNLALILIEDRPGVKQDYVEAIRWLERAASQENYDPIFRQRRTGVAEAEHTLGILYSEGIYVRKDKFMAADWFEKAVDHGYGSSANNLGLMYMNGDGVARDWKRAESLFLFAASHGDHNAADNLTILFLALEKPEKALEWNNIASEKGSLHAISNKTKIDAMFKDQQRTMDQYKVIEWEKENNLLTENLTMNERIDRKLESESSKAHGLYENLKRIAIELTTPKGPVDPIEGFKFDLEELEKYSHSSEIAKKMYEAMSHFLLSWEILIDIPSGKISFDNKLCQEFIKELAQCYKLEYIVACFTLPMIDQASQIASTFISHLDSLRKRRNLDKIEEELDQDARICFAHLNCSSFGDIIGFVSNSIKKYPKNKYLLTLRGSFNAFLQKYEDSLKDFNKVLDMEPENYELLYFRAVCLRYLNHPKTVEAYEEYLFKAPIDDRKRPEACYAIGTFKFDGRASPHSRREKEMLKEVKKYYRLGQEMEKNQLPFFLPYESNSREMLEYILNFEKFFEKKKPAPSQAKSNCTNPSRKELIIQHRQFISDVRTGLFGGPNRTPLLWKPPKEQKLPSSLAGMKSVYLNQINFTKDHVLENAILEVTLIDRAHRNGQSIMLVVEDKDKNVQRVSLYRFNENDPDVKELGIGSKLSIISPYVRLAIDGKPEIRVDEPSSVIFGEKCEDICAYCGCSPADFACDGCRITKYCSRECKVEDWTKFQHQLICVREEEKPKSPLQSQESKKKRKRRKKTKRTENTKEEMNANLISTP